MRRDILSASSKTHSACAVACASPAFLNAVGLVSVSGSAIASWYDHTTAPCPGTEVWSVSVCPGQPTVNCAFPEPIVMNNGIVVSVTGGCAMTAFRKQGA